MKDKNTNKAFIVDLSKTEKFLSAKIHTASEAINRINNRKTNK